MKPEEPPAVGSSIKAPKTLVSHVVPPATGAAPHYIVGTSGTSGTWGTSGAWGSMGTYDPGMSPTPLPRSVGVANRKRASENYREAMRSAAYAYASSPGSGVPSPAWVRELAVLFYRDLCAAEGIELVEPK